MTHEFAPPFIDWKKALSGVRKYKSFWFFKRFVLLLRSQFFAKNCLSRPVHEGERGQKWGKSEKIFFRA